MERIVIVGAGLTALRAAERLRELKFDGEIVIVGDEPHKPYHTKISRPTRRRGGWRAR